MGDLVALNNGARRQCKEIAERTGEQCLIRAQEGSEYCWRHNPDRTRKVVEPSKMSMAEQLKAAEQQIMDLVPIAMQALVDVLTGEDTKPADRIKAAQMVIDRSVAQRIQVETVNSDTRDLDSEIEDALAEVRDELRTGTDG